MDVCVRVLGAKRRSGVLVKLQATSELLLVLFFCIGGH